MKKIFGFILTCIIIITNLYIPVSAREIPLEAFRGSWYGRRVGTSNSEYVNRYMNLIVETIRNDGSFIGKGYVTTVAGQGHDNEWISVSVKGQINLEDLTFSIQSTSEISSSPGTSWDYRYKDEGQIVFDKDEFCMKGLTNEDTNRPFYYAKVSNWAKDEITEANAYGLIPETLQGKDMEKPVSRSEFVAIAVQLYEALSQKNVEITDNHFVDIENNPNEEFIKKAYSLNIAMGVTNTHFEPDAYINREQIATMLCRTIKKYKFDDWSYEKDSEYYMDSEGVAKFEDDADISDYAKESVYYMVKLGIIKGVTETLFAPKNITAKQEADGYATATREQAIALSLRIYKHSGM